MTAADLMRHFGDSNSDAKAQGRYNHFVDHGQSEGRLYPCEIALNYCDRDPVLHQQCVDEVRIPDYCVSVSTITMPVSTITTTPYQLRSACPPPAMRGRGLNPRALNPKP